MSETADKLDCWAILELMGHRRLAGRLQEKDVAGAAMLQLDIPKDDGDEAFVTQFYSGSAVYCITPCTEEIARDVAAKSYAKPVYELAPTTKRISQDDDGMLDEDPADYF